VVILGWASPAGSLRSCKSLHSFKGYFPSPSILLLLSLSCYPKETDLWPDSGSPCIWNLRVQWIVFSPMHMRVRTPPTTTHTQTRLIGLVPWGCAQCLWPYICSRRVIFLLFGSKKLGEKRNLIPIYKPFIKCLLCTGHYSWHWKYEDEYDRQEDQSHGVYNPVQVRI
jgi:hypothetical protein